MHQYKDKLIRTKLKNPQIIIDAQESTPSKYFVIPYIENLSENVTNIMRSNSTYKLAYRGINILSKIINSHKDRTPKELKNNVVYKIKCSNCDATYVGQTKRKLTTRINEHKKIKPSSNNVVANHALDYNHKYEWDDIEILDTEQSYYKRLISEVTYIQSQSRAITINQDLLGESYLPIINKFKR